MDAIDIGRTGVAAGLRRMTVAAVTVVQAGTASSAATDSSTDTRRDAGTAGGVPAADPVNGLVELYAGRREVEASLKLIGVAARVERHAVDRWG